MDSTQNEQNANCFFNKKNLHLRKKGSEEGSKELRCINKQSKNKVTPENHDFPKKCIIIYFFLTAKIAESCF